MLKQPLRFRDAVLGQRAGPAGKLEQLLPRVASRSLHTPTANRFASLPSEMWRYAGWKELPGAYLPELPDGFDDEAALEEIDRDELGCGFFRRLVRQRRSLAGVCRHDRKDHKLAKPCDVVLSRRHQ